VTRNCVLVTGGAGYIGSHVNLHLKQAGYTTVVLDNLIHGHESSVICGDFIKGDLAVKSDIETVFEKYQIACVMHFAAYAYVGESVEDPQKYYENNVNGTLNLLNVMLKYGVKDIVFSSTCATYGIPLELPITESHPQKPINPYGASKMMVERILGDYGHAYGLRSAVLRYFNAAGADPLCRIGERHDPETHLIPLVLAAADQGTPVHVFGNDYDTADGTCVRDYIHVNDLAVAHELAMKYIFDTGQSAIFNLGNEQGFSVNEVIRIAEAVTGKAVDTRYSARRPGDPAILIAAADLAKRDLGWKPLYNTLSQIVETAWEWQKVSAKLSSH
jgi:UDP-glucose 4-epimerase